MSQELENHQVSSQGDDFWGELIADRLAVLTPLSAPSASLALASLSAGYSTILDLGEGWGRGLTRGLSALTSLKHAQRIGVRVSMSGGRASWRADQISSWVERGQIARVFIDESEDWGLWSALRAQAPNLDYEVWVEARTESGARRALDDSRVSGVILVTSEAAGACGDRSALLWLQDLERIRDRGEPKELATKPIGIRGGMTVSGITAALVAGVDLILLDEHLIGAAELTLPTALSVVYPKLGRAHSERRLVVKETQPTNPRAPHLPSAEDRAARCLMWPQTFGWSLHQAQRDLRQPISASWGDDLNNQLVPLGACWPQIRSVAARLEVASQEERREARGERQPRCAEIVRGLISEVSQRISSAERHPSPLCPPRPFSDQLGIRYPIFQGPMTRVSDRPEFALAIAKEGALPFLALSLLTPMRARALLEETQALLGDLPWGVGILGFSPPELRRAHLELVKSFKPSAVLIAGGRPSQSRSLESEGIPTYLHAPSPELLEMFIKEGARRFIFEGSECGGHIGPLSSATLWDAQIATLSQSDHLDELEVLFAGGIHDASSAGLLSAMVGDLTSRGLSVGVVMGTAYLFTREAVTTSAISPLYQEVALKTRETSTLHTAPGHATRCAETPFVEEFERAHAQLVDEGVDERERWASLEQLNVGRLRVASKGIKRVGEDLIEVTEEEQRREGMYMLGEVATLRDEVITLRALHDQVALESGDWLHQRLSALRSSAQRAPLSASGGRVALDARDERRGLRDHASPGTSYQSQDRDEIAIIGIASLFPGAEDTERFWENILSQVDTITEVPETRWSTEIYYDPEAPAGRASASRWGGFLDPIPFDAMRYGIAPQTLAAVEPVQLLALEVAARALRDAGYQPLPKSGARSRTLPRERTSVIFGAEAGTDLAGAYTLRGVYPHWAGALPPELDGVLPTLTEDSFAGVLANVIAGRVANRLDLGGVNFTVDAACASSLSALDAAVKSLKMSESDVVICGGADLHNSVNDYLMFSSVHALSKTGRCRPFDQSADGIALGEGVGVIVLKRLSDARRDGDRVYATIASVAGSSDGKALGLTAPRREGQERALRRAHQRAGVSPREIELIEAHGTGTVVGDRTELGALTEVFQADEAQVRGCTLGSVKSQIGHTKCAAGMAGLIKVALSIYHRTRPPTLHLQEPNHAYRGEESPFTFEAKPRPWLNAHERRVGAVSAFGFGGTNFHAVLREHRGASSESRARRAWPVEAIPLRGESLESAREVALRLSGALSARREHQAPHDLKLRDLAISALHLAEGDSPNSLATHAVIIAGDLAEAEEALGAFGRGEVHSAIVSERLANRHLNPAQIALLFPGQGAQKVGMLSELFLSLPRLAERLDADPETSSLIFPPAPLDRAEKRAQQANLTDTRNAQPALGLCDLAAFDLLRSLGVKAGHLGGHSYGELVALCVAGVIPESSLLQISRTRGEMILAATGALSAESGGDPGSMAAVKGDASSVQEALEAHPELKGVVLANMNAPLQTVISGPTEQIKSAIKALKEVKLRGREIPVACAFHSPLVASAEDEFRRYLEQQQLRPLPTASQGPLVWSNQHARPYREAGQDEPTVAEHLGAHLASPVRFVDQVNAMIEAGVELFIEVGPGRILSGLVEQITGADKADSIITLPLAPERGDLREALTTLGSLDCLTDPLDWYQLLKPRGARQLSISELSAPHPARLLWWVDGQRAWPAQGPLPSHGLRVMTEPVVVNAHSSVSPPALSVPAPPLPDPLSAEREVTHSRSTYEPTRAQTLPFTSTFSLNAEAMMSSSQHHGSAPSPTPPLQLEGAPPEVAHAARAYFESMRALAESQSQVMLALLGASGRSLTSTTRPSSPQINGGAPFTAPSASQPQQLESSALDFWGAPSDQAEPTRSSAPTPRPELSPSPAEAVPRDPSGGAPPVEEMVKSGGELSETAQEMSNVNIGEALTHLVSERTGYPVEMLDETLDLESDLSIDSIKRIEILGALAEQLGLTDQGEEERDLMIEELATKRTLGEMIAWLEESLAETSSTEEVTSTVDAHDEGSADEGGPEESNSEESGSNEEVMRPKSKGERLPLATRRWVDAPLSDAHLSATSGPQVELIELSLTDPHPTLTLFRELKRLWSLKSSWRGLVVTAPTPSNPLEALTWEG